MSAWVSVGTLLTAEFAVEPIRRGWALHGQRTVPDAARLLVTADAGGSNGYQVRAWRIELAKPTAETGVQITVCHYPPGDSKWNRIEHRMFSFITMHWRGRPLMSYCTTVDGDLRHHLPIATTAAASWWRLRTIILIPRVCWVGRAGLCSEVRC